MKTLFIPILALILGVASLTSCNDWLDVRGENIQKEDDQFEAYKGFRDALTGCYMAMASTDIYGQRLTMTDVENLAALWYTDDGDKTRQPLVWQLTHHAYTGDEARAAIKAIYGGLFYTITSANVLLKNLDEKGGRITEAKVRAVIEGEACAIRAYCQFDVLRLFGQLPSGGTKKVSLPYSATTDISQLPAYYPYDAYVAKLKADIEKAESLLKGNDPIFSHTWDELNYAGAGIQDDYMYFRQSRLNYWAVRALHARMALYTGDRQTAHDIALEIINAKGSDGKPLITLSGVGDLQKGYNGLPSECLFYLSKYNLEDYANDKLIGGNSTQMAASGFYYITAAMLNDLYKSIPNASASHNRYLNEWNRNVIDPSSNVCPTLKKYWYDTGSADGNFLSTKYQIIPMLRLSEMYLIAVETATSLTQAQELYKTYMTSCEFTLYQPFTSTEKAGEEMVNEMRREFYGEGQMFFTYKRKFSRQMLWNSDPISEDAYILPLPSSEYNPDNVK